MYLVSLTPWMPEGMKRKKRESGPEQTAVLRWKRGWSYLAMVFSRSPARQGVWDIALALAGRNRLSMRQYRPIPTTLFLSFEPALVRSAIRSAIQMRTNAFMQEVISCRKQKTEAEMT